MYWVWMSPLFAGRIAVGKPLVQQYGGIEEPLFPDLSGWHCTPCTANFGLDTKKTSSKGHHRDENSREQWHLWHLIAPCWHLTSPHDISLAPMCANGSSPVLYQGLMIFWRWFPGFAIVLCIFWGGDGWKCGTFVLGRGGELTPGDHARQSVTLVWNILDTPRVLQEDLHGSRGVWPLQI